MWHIYMWCLNFQTENYFEITNFEKPKIQNWHESVFVNIYVQRYLFVASPKASAKSPVASGSKVPAWPAFLAPSAHLALLTKAADVIPIGLSMINHPDMSRPLRCLAIL